MYHNPAEILNGFLAVTHYNSDSGNEKLVSSLLVSALGNCSRCCSFFKDNDVPATNFICVWECGKSLVNAKSKVQRAAVTHPFEARCVGPSPPLLKAAARNTSVWSEAFFQAHCHRKGLV